MIRFLLIIINTFAIFLLQLFTPDDGIVVKGNFPLTITAGQEVPVDITVRKGEMGGFAKLQMEVPAGLSVKGADEAGASYTFEEGIAKWVWATLPADNEILIRMTLVAEKDGIGIKTIVAKYSFVENNVKQTIEMSPAVVTIIEGEPAVTTYAAVAPESTVQPVADSAALRSATQALASNSVEPPHEVTVKRTVAAGQSLNEFLVSVSIKKGDTKGFARYSDDMPEGLTVKPVNTEGASFSIGEGKLKFVWVNVPAADELNISYILSGGGISKADLKGEFSYLENNQSKKVLLETETVTFPQPEIVKEEPKAAPPEVVKPKELARTVLPKSTAPARSNVYFVVQIGAFKKGNVTAQKLQKKYHILDKISSEMQGGYTKFMVGSHDQYRLARDHRELVKTKNKVTTAFVAAYAHGKRITVQEALMINNQQWFK
jgi:hypothetical protein